jgi:hypothetical protein
MRTGASDRPPFGAGEIVSTNRPRGASPERVRHRQVFRKCTFLRHQAAHLSLLSFTFHVLSRPTAEVVAGDDIALSKSLYDFAHVLGSAAEYVKSLGLDISLFCGVLREVQSTLTRAKLYRLSKSAIDTNQAIIGRCSVIFADLDGEVVRLQNRKTKPDFMARVKWYFREKRVLLVHEQLKTCSTTLHLMLTTLQFAQKIASNR